MPKNLTNEEIIDLVSQSLRTRNHPVHPKPLKGNMTFKIRIEAEEVIISRFASFPLEAEELETLRDSLSKLIKDKPLVFKEWTGDTSWENHMEIRFNVNLIKIETPPTSDQPVILSKQYTPMSTGEEKKSEMPVDTLFWMAALTSLIHQNASFSHSHGFLPVPKQKTAFVVKDQLTLDKELLTLFLDSASSVNSQEVIALLNQGASPSRRLEVTFPPEKKLKTSYKNALNESLMLWAFTHSYMQDTPLDKCRGLLKAHTKETPLIAKANFMNSRTDTYQYLFGEEPRAISDKNKAVREILIDCAQLLATPEKCMPFFELIERELRKEWLKNHEMPVPVLDEKVYQVKCHDGTLYPVAKARYVKECFTKKDSLLQKVLFRMWFEAGLVKAQPQKWIQGIPRKKSIKYLREFIFFVEDTGNPTGLLHGKISHNIQRLLIVWAIKNGLINTQVGGFNITQEELFLSLMDPSFAHSATKGLLWQKMLDQRHLDGNTFSDPHQLHSFLMTSENRSQFRFLSDCMIHSFCNGMLKISEILNSYLKENSWTPSLVWDKILSCMQTEIFFDFKPNFELQARKNWYGLPIIDQGKNHVILQKNYGENEQNEQNEQNPSDSENNLQQSGLAQELDDFDKYYAFINDGLQQATAKKLPDNTVSIIHEYHDSANVYQALVKQGVFANTNKVLPVVKEQGERQKQTVSIHL